MFFFNVYDGYDYYGFLKMEDIRMNQIATSSYQNLSIDDALMDYTHRKPIFAIQCKDGVVLIELIPDSAFKCQNKGN
jgi:hypothetical protein